MSDQVKVTTQVAVSPEEAFRVFTEEIDAWWRRGLKYRVSGRHPGTLRLEPRTGGRLYETYESNGRARMHQAGTVIVWSPPTRLVFEWRAANFAKEERTEVEVLFEPASSGTQVTLIHRGWDRIRADHPSRHGQETAAFLRGLGLWWGELLSALREHVTP